MVSFRRSERVIVWDLFQVLQRIFTPGAHTNYLFSRERHCHRIIWRFSKDVVFTIYAFNVVTYGRPASTILEVVKRLMVELGKEASYGSTARGS